MAPTKSKREPYDPPKIFHDSFESYAFEPDKEEREAFRNRRRANGRLSWLEARKKQWAAEDKAFDEWRDAANKRRAKELIALAELDKKILAAEKEFEQHIKAIQDYYAKEHAKEK